MIFKCYSSEELITLNTLHEVAPPGTHFTAESTEAMRIKSLAQGEKILMLRFEPATFVSKIDILTTTPIVHNDDDDDSDNSNDDNKRKMAPIPPCCDVPHTSQPGGYPLAVLSHQNFILHKGSQLPTLCTVL